MRTNMEVGQLAAIDDGYGDDNVVGTVFDISPTGMTALYYGPSKDDAIESGKYRVASADLVYPVYECPNCESFHKA